MADGSGTSNTPLISSTERDKAPHRNKIVETRQSDEDNTSTVLHSHRSSIDNESEDDDDPLTANASDESRVGRPTLLVWLLTATAGISGLLFGYDTGVISATLVSIHTDLSNRELTTLDKSLITAVTALFALFASPIAGYLADKYGRKAVILFADILFIAGALLQAISSSVTWMIVGRAVVGLAIGGASLVVPLFISEISPSSFRGRLVTLSVLAITLGQVVAYGIGYLFSTTTHGWRYMVSIGALPAILQFFLLSTLPESPRWLVKAGREGDARKVLTRIYSTNSDYESRNLVDTVLRSIAHDARQEEEARTYLTSASQSRSAGFKSPILLPKGAWTDLFAVPANRRALAIACLLQGLQQLCGFNSLMYFSATLFDKVGFSSPTATALTVAITNALFTIAALLVIDRAGRRAMLLYTVPAMALALLCCAAAFLFVKMTPTQSSPSTNQSLKRSHSTTMYSRAENDAKNTTSTAAASLVLASLLAYVASYALGLGIVPWQQSELFSLSVRSRGSGLATATNWAANFVIGVTFLPLMGALGATAVFMLYAIVCAAGWVCVRKVYPETAGLGLEDVQRLLDDGWGVEESLRRREND